MKGLTGRKLGMTQVFLTDGKLVPVTVVEVLPNVVLQKKTIETDGYEAVQLGTRFLVSQESTIHDNFKGAVLKARDIDTTITGLITGHPVRGLRNKLTREYEKIERIEGGKESPDWKKLEDLGKGA